MTCSYSTTVVFEKPSDPVVKKWQLACTGTCEDMGWMLIELYVVGNIAHVVVMPSVSKEKLKSFFDEFMADHTVSKCVRKSIGSVYCFCPDCAECQVIAS